MNMQIQEPAGGTTLDTLQLDGWHLDYFTGLALGYEMFEGHPFNPSGNYGDLGVVLLKIRTLMWGGDGKVNWMARADGCAGFARGPSPELAMCRAVVFGKFGKSVKLPSCAGGLCADSYKNDSDVADGCEDLFA